MIEMLGSEDIQVIGELVTEYLRLGIGLSLVFFAAGYVWYWLIDFLRGGWI